MISLMMLYNTYENQYIVILITAKDKKEAVKIAQGLLEAKLIACANIIDGVQSLFWWQGKIDSSKEVLLVLKTNKTLFKKIVLKLNPYTVIKLRKSLPYL